MSTSAPQPTEEEKLHLPVPRTRLQPVGGAGKSLYIALICLGLSIVGALASGSYAKGGAAHIKTNAPDAPFRVDNSFGSTSSSGSAELVNLPYGERAFRVEHRDYEPLSTTIGVGWLSSNRFNIQLTPIPLTLRIDTLPGADVLLNGQRMGTANSRGVLSKQGLLPGDYDIEVKLTGYVPFQQRRHLSPKYEQVYAGLRISPERLRQAQEEQRLAQENAGRVQQLIGAARQEFNSRQYKAALGTIEAALRLDPANQEAQQVKNQIVQTMNVLR